MPTLDLMAVAELRVKNLTQRREQLQKQLADVTTEENRLLAFLATGKTLMAGKNSLLPLSHSAAPVEPLKGGFFGDRATSDSDLAVKQGTKVAFAATLIRDNGPMKVRDIAQKYIDDTNETTRLPDLAILFNSAMWRRKDLFLKKGGLIELTRKDFVVVD
ncbi:hypothetical protein BH11PLA2_BH11PLA2_42350 [soil metagenome]